MPPLEEVSMGDPVSDVPPPMTNGEIKEVFFTLIQEMTSQYNSITLQIQSMMAQMNRQVGPRVPQHANIMLLHLREFTRANPHMYYRSRADEDPQFFLDEVYKNYAICLTSIEKAELSCYELKYVAQTWYAQWRDNRTLR